MAVKNVLVVYYTQSGQLGEIATAFTHPLVQRGTIVETIRIKPKNDFPFPWTSDSFFDAMPESVLGISVEMEDFHPILKKYDLIILGYQPWFLSPSIPTASLLEKPTFKEIVKDTPVITLIGARNMWLNAQEKLKEKLKELGARLVGNVALVDRHQNHVSAVTILHWMLGGKKDKWLGFFPLPGISENDISSTNIFGEIVFYHLEQNNWGSLQPALVNANAVEAKSDLMFIEHRAKRLFSIWANLVRSKKNRHAWLVAYKYYLLFALFIVAPIVLVINNLLFRIFFLRQIKRKKQYYLGVN